ncbi:DUF5694 domain-containing protein [Streptococcus marmotae]|uniref:DUF5694 domain-containing protein n=1 Tax=Streptococcus marmotae TaxID=1825069 RepID=UPI00082F0FDF|nr:DUF5694 domain-containing protein [Streptococcus marmotae]
MVKVMVVGTFHMESQADVHHLQDTERIHDFGTEFAELVEKFKAFQPTKICVEWESKHQDQLLQYFANWRSGQVTSTNEIVQLAFPLAKASQAELVAIDWMEEGQGLYGFGDIMDELVNQPALQAELERYILEQTDLDKGIAANLRFYNSPQFVAAAQAYYTNVARVGRPGREVGIGWLIWWYQRNLMIFSKLFEQQAVDDRVLILIGASHKGILEQMLADSQQVELVDVNDYL